ncbi:unnamed protein product [Acanthoscelides obtectus]|uniref:Uncharacterized protein n=1 Tax=Acanthoscelides obtectus TaxID=200917 RepID=A0A9P0M0L8_ACAOB|nr:unnamed protein product [Acanthoscelides obtectus]CAK1644591.1 hypothetical protein AOBTE_LOCUS13887 [Acanthoscelides obtectus]
MPAIYRPKAKLGWVSKRSSAMGDNRCFSGGALLKTVETENLICPEFSRDSATAPRFVQTSISVSSIALHKSDNNNRQAASLRHAVRRAIQEMSARETERHELMGPRASARETEDGCTGRTLVADRRRPRPAVLDVCVRCRGACDDEGFRRLRAASRAHRRYRINCWKVEISLTEFALESYRFKLPKKPNVRSAFGRKILESCHDYIITGDVVTTADELNNKIERDRYDLFSSVFVRSIYMRNVGVGGEYHLLNKLTCGTDGSISSSRHHCVALFLSLTWKTDEITFPVVRINRNYLLI